VDVRRIVGQSGQGVDDRQAAGALGLGQGSAKLVCRPVLDRGQGHGGRVAELGVGQELAQAGDRLAAPGPLQLLAEVGLVVRRQIAVEILRQHVAELAARVLVAGDQRVIHHAVQAVVGLDVLLAARFAEHLDETLDKGRPALGDLGHGPLDLLLVNALGVHTPAVGRG